jgi:tetratricopeptide (TPR) repeat protein
VESKALLGKRGAYRLAAALPSIQMPSTVQAVLAARIDRLPPEEKRLLQSAAVIGKDVPFLLLHEIAGEREEELRGSLAHLQAAEFLYEASLFPELEYTFKHALTHEVAYGSVLQQRRRELHTQVAEAVERLYADRLTEHVERLAHHAFRGDLWGKAVTYLRQAGAKASAHSAYREAVARFERALEALHHMPESRGTLEQAIDLRFDLRSSLFPLGELEMMVKHLREAERLAKVLDDQQRVGWASVYMSEYFRLTGSLTEARRFAQSACAIAKPLGNLSLQVAANFSMGSILLSDDFRQAAGFFRKVTHSLEGDLSCERCRLAGFPAVMSRSYLAFALAHLGGFDEGVAHGLEGVRLAETFDHPFSLAFACWGLGELYRIKGRHPEAVTMAERGLALCRDWNLTVLSGVLTRLLGDVYARSGRVVEGVSLLQRAQTDAERTGRAFSLALVLLGEACILAKRTEDADEFARRAVAICRERGERGNQAYALRLLGEIATHRDPRALTPAESHYREALVVAEGLGMRPLVAHCHLGLARLYRRTDKRDQAHEHLTTATAMYREMDMRFWLEQAETESMELQA